MTSAATMFRLDRPRTICSSLLVWSPPATGAPVYLSIDIDCLDPAFAPGTGTPVAGGLETNKLLQIVRGLSNLNIVAADIMEVAPSYDRAEVTALAAATLGLEILHIHAVGKPDS